MAQKNLAHFKTCQIFLCHFFNLNNLAIGFLVSATNRNSGILLVECNRVHSGYSKSYPYLAIGLLVHLLTALCYLSLFLLMHH